MTTFDVMQVDFAALETISTQFTTQAAQITAVQQAVHAAFLPLAQGNWLGAGQAAFVQFMETSTFPAFERLCAALEQASATTRAVNAAIGAAECEAAALFRGSYSAQNTPSATLAAEELRVGGVPLAALSSIVELPPGAEPPAKGFGSFLTDFIQRFMRRGAVTDAQATAIFNDMADEPDIPFKFGDDGCYARADLMTQRIIARYAVAPNDIYKVLITDDDWTDTEAKLRVPTENRYPEPWSSSDGEINWNWHIAPVIKVLQPDGTAEFRVIDPSLFDHPVPIDEWKARMNYPDATVELRDRNWYNPVYFVDPNDPEARADTDAFSAEKMFQYQGYCKDAGYCQ